MSQRPTPSVQIQGVSTLDRPTSNGDRTEDRSPGSAPLLPPVVPWFLSIRCRWSDAHRIPVASLFAAENPAFATRPPNRCVTRGPGKEWLRTRQFIVIKMVFLYSYLNSFIYYGSENVSSGPDDIFEIITWN